MQILHKKLCILGIYRLGLGSFHQRNPPGGFVAYGQESGDVFECIAFTTGISDKSIPVGFQQGGTLARADINLVFFL